MRDDMWLTNRLDQIWNFLFPEVEKKNKVLIKFKGRWKNKFGHIEKKGRISEIVINGYFKDKLIPEYIIDLTIAHELIHYMHGFNSPHKQLFKYPHQGGVVRKELLKRGFGHMFRKEKEFIKKEWPLFLKSRERKVLRI